MHTTAVTILYLNLYFLLNFCIFFWYLIKFDIQLHQQLSKSCVGAQIWILSLSCPSGLAVAQYQPHILWPTDIDNECKRSLGSDRDYPQHFCHGTWRGVSPASCHWRLEQAMNGAKAGLGMTCREEAAPHSAGFGFVSNPCRLSGSRPNIWRRFFLPYSYKML